MNIAELKKQFDGIKTKAAIAESELNKLMKQLAELGIKDLKMAEKEMVRIEKELEALETEQGELIEKANQIMNGEGEEDE
jgi:phage-related tail protein